MVELHARIAPGRFVKNLADFIVGSIAAIDAIAQILIMKDQLAAPAGSGGERAPPGGPGL